MDTRRCPLFAIFYQDYGAGKLQIRDTTVQRITEKKALVSQSALGLNSALAQYSIHRLKPAIAMDRTAKMIFTTTNPNAAVTKYATNSARSAYKIRVKMLSSCRKRFCLFSMSVSSLVNFVLFYHVSA